MKVHALKTWPEAFEGHIDGTKTFEARLNDRGFEVGDMLRLREWDPETEKYTGSELVRTVSCILLAPGYGAVVPGYCILGLHGMPLGVWS